MLYPVKFNWREVRGQSDMPEEHLSVVCVFNILYNCQTNQLSAYLSGNRKSKIEIKLVLV